QTQAATFTLTASNAAGSTSATVSVAYVPLPSIASFTATPSTTAAGGGTVTFAWSASDATTLAIDHGVGDVTGLATKSIAVTASTTYTLTASNASGATMRQVTVTVPATPPAPPAIGAFSATPATLAYPGGASTLAWTVSDATAIAIDHGVGSVTGSTSVPVNVTATTTYTLSASNAAGTSTAQVTVAVGAPPPPPPPQQPPTIASFTATPDSLPVGGGSTTLAWSTNGADTVAIDHGVGTVTGTSRSVSVATTTTYVLTASNGAGSVTAQVIVNVAGSALDRYADAVNGNDANDGSAAAPFRTIGKALAQTPSGATAWLFNGSYTRVAEGLAGISRLTVPDGRTLAALNRGAATIGFGLTMAASGHVNGVVIDNGGLDDSAIVANGGTVGLSRIAVRNSGRCDAAVSVAGGANVTLDSGGDAAHSYAGPGVHGFAHVRGGGTLTIVGGRIEGAGQLLCTGRGVLTAESQGHLRLDGVTIVDADFLTPSGGGINAVIASSDSATLTLVGTVIDGATVPDGEDSVGIDLRFGVATSALSMSTSTISRMAGRGAAIAAGSGTIDIATSTFTGDGYGISNGGRTLRLTVTDTLFSANRYGGIDLDAGSAVVVSGTTFTDNWKTAGALNTDPTATAIALRGDSYAFTLRNSTIQGNGNTSVARPAIFLGGTAGSTFNLGDGTNPGGNVLADNANVNLWVNTDRAVLVKAVGNRWTASAQGADASGHYVVPSGLCGTTPCDLTSGAGANFKVLFGTLRLVE
ncbi:MAG: right-handed parallel beta-helix repeat-containing protein, partial [Caldimonas sp.]